MLNEIKGGLMKMSNQVENVSKEKKNDLKKSQMEILELKNTIIEQFTIEHDSRYKLAEEESANMKIN